MKACFADNALLPSDCVLDTGETWNCVHAPDLKRKEACPHYDEQLSVELCSEILGDRYLIVKRRTV